MKKEPICNRNLFNFNHFPFAFLFPSFLSFFSSPLATSRYPNPWIQSLCRSLRTYVRSSAFNQRAFCISQSKGANETRSFAMKFRHRVERDWKETRSFCWRNIPRSIRHGLYRLYSGWDQSNVPRSKGRSISSPKKSEHPARNTLCLSIPRDWSPTVTSFTLTIFLPRSSRNWLLSRDASDRWKLFNNELFSNCVLNDCGVWKVDKRSCE